MTDRKKIEQNETKVENKIEIKTGKQQVAAIHSNCIGGHEDKNETQDSRQTQHPGKSLVHKKSLYFS